MPGIGPLILAENFDGLYKLIFGLIVGLVLLAAGSFLASARGHWSGVVMAAGGGAWGAALLFRRRGACAGGIALAIRPPRGDWDRVDRALRGTTAAVTARDGRDATYDALFWTRASTTSGEVSVSYMLERCFPDDPVVFGYG
jgi:hypothetical protein